MKLYAFHGGGEKGDMAIFDPFDPRVGTKIDIPYFFYLIQHSKGNVLFDTGGHPDLIDNPRGRLGAAADAFELTMQRGDDAVSKLSTLGLTPNDIDHVVLSHLHYDHAGCIEFFPNAAFYAQHTELSFAHWPAVYQRAIYIKADFDHPVRWRELTGEYDFFGDGRIVLFPTPGHTPGHQSMLVQLDSHAIILVADAAYLPKNIEERVLPAICWSPDAMVSSWERIEELQRRHNAELIFTHDLGFREKTRLAPERWYE